MEGCNVARVGKVGLDEYVGEVGGVCGQDVGCLLKEKFEGHNVGEMCEYDKVDKAGWFVAVARSWAKLAKDAFVTTRAVMWTCRSVANV